MWVGGERRKVCGVKGRGGRCVGWRGEEEGVWGEGERVKVCGVKGRG